MQGNLLFEYAVIRVVPRVEREEFLNIGIVLYCQQARFLQTRYSINEARLLACCEDIDIPALRAYLEAFEKISRGDKDGGPIARLDIASRFRWLTATRSTILQTSRVHSGLSADLPATLDRLYRELVL